MCGASAALATSTVVPSYERKSADVAFAVIAANAVSTLAMLIYPLIAVALGYDPKATGIFLGATIHDVAQVVGAGYAVSEPVGNAAVIVKLFRVFLLLPVVLGIGWWLAAGGVRTGAAKVPVPMFAIMFLVLCIVNTAASVDARAGAGLRPGEGRARRRRDLGPAARHRRARRRHQRGGAALHQLAARCGVLRRDGGDPARGRRGAAGDGVVSPARLA